MQSNDQHPPPLSSPLAEPETERRSISVIFPTVEPILTYALLLILGVIFLYAQSLPRFDRLLFQINWEKINERIYDGEYYRLLSSMFLHLDMAHIIFNGLALYIFGRDVEAWFGHARFAIIYFLGGLAGSIGSLLFTDAPSIGASGAIFAIFSATAVYYYHQRHIFGRYAMLRLRQLIFLGAFNLFIGFVSTMPIDNAAHIGGIIGGFILAWFISPDFEARRTPDGNIMMVDKNTLDQWWFVPLMFAVGLVVIVVYAASVLG
jgi:rhomboid protease GluP